MEVISIATDPLALRDNKVAAFLLKVRGNEESEETYHPTFRGYTAKHLCQKPRRQSVTVTVAAGKATTTI